MLVYIVQDGDHNFVDGEIMAVFDNLTSAIEFAAEYETTLDEGMDNRSYEFYARAVTAFYNGEETHKAFNYYPSCFIREMEVRG